MKRFSLLLALLPLAASAQTLEEYNALAEKKDSLGQQALLNKWEKKGTPDPDFYVAAFNYHVNHSRKQLIALKAGTPEGDALVMKDSVGNIAGYFGSSTAYDPDDIKKALAYIDKGIEKFPDRLDMRFGKAYLLSETKDWQGLTGTVLTIIDQSDTIKNKWKWKEGELLEDSKVFMLDNIQSYVLELYNANDGSLLPYMAQIAARVLTYYPEHIESLSNLSIVYMLQNQPDKALVLLLKAEKINPADMIVLSNIAHCYKMKGDTANALKYYENMVKNGDSESKAFAADQISKLKNN
ncbi:tetratricopeptide repeat protein [uncultured Flavobacterium sp.]|uniref:tetratricopeptide repeat protein n=1 Tax=uncultured Flavobacterium sp. TaxID=165435 RepID=UPI0025D83650|nr:tetratricopeptide repeat protein [uncultured Flavobacterium sp.]